jgi:Flp pilus assembly protein TadG
MPKLPAIARRLAGSRIVRDERGVTAIEFGLLALPFFALLGAILETSLVFLGAQVLDAAVYDASRQIRTGQAQQARMTADGFRSLVCTRLYGLFDCSGLRVNVSVVEGGFGGVNVPPPVETTCTTTCDWAEDESFVPGQGQQIVLVRVYYKWPTMLNIGGFGLADQPDGTRLMAGVEVFRNEPF